MSLLAPRAGGTFSVSGSGDINDMDEHVGVPQIIEKFVA